MSKSFFLPISKEVLLGLLALFLQMASYAQEDTVIDNKGNIIMVKNTRVTTAAAEPGDPVQNDIWFDTTDNVTKIYDGAAWIIINEDALASKEDAANKSADVTLADATNTKFPTELAVKTYVDDQVATSLEDDDWYQENSTDTPDDIDQSIFTNGNVGIGTASPSAHLDIESTGVPLEIKPSTATPTGTQPGQIFMGNEGILYAYDGNRSKWLSVDRNMIGWGRSNGTTTNEYLRQFNGSISLNNGWRIIRNATITAITVQTNDADSWILEIRKNDAAAPIISFNISASEGAHNNNLNIDVNEGDFLQAYCNGASINHPQALIEIAWRK